MVLKRHEYKPKKKKKKDPEVFGLRKFLKRAEDQQSSGGRNLELISEVNEEEKLSVIKKEKTHKRDIKNNKNENKEKKYHSSKRKYLVKKKKIIN